MAVHNTKCFAHRGFSGRYPENTMLAFRKAVEEGCDGIELDVHLTRDGEVVVIHDETIDRVTNGRGAVQDYTAAELKQFNAANGKSAQFPDVTIPTLREYFDFIKDLPIVTNIELKNSITPYTGMEKKVIDMIREYGLSDRIIFSSFNHESIVLCKELAPDIPCGLLDSSRIAFPADYCRLCHAEYLHPFFITLDDQYVRDLHKEGIGINSWTINEEKDIRRFIALGINGVITNYPDRFARVARDLSTK